MKNETSPCGIIPQSFEYCLSMLLTVRPNSSNNNIFVQQMTRYWGKNYTFIFHLLQFEKPPGYKRAKSNRRDLKDNAVFTERSKMIQILNKLKVNSRKLYWSHTTMDSQQQTTGYTTARNLFLQIGDLIISQITIQMSL